MTVGLAVLMAGLFLVPAVLLWLGHRLSRRGRVARGVFWGALFGHTVAVGPTLLLSMLPPAYWSEDDVWRGVLGFGALSGAAAIGAGIGAARQARAPKPPAPTRGRAWPASSREAP